MFDFKFLFIGAIVIGAMGVYIKYLNSEIADLESINATLNNANINLATAFNEEQERTKRQIDEISKAKNEVKKEVQYVEKIKYKIIKENNSTCISSLNDVFARLRQKRDTNSTDTK